MAQWLERVTLELGIVGLSPTLSVKITLKKNPLKENQPRDEKDVGKLVMANMNPDSACKIITSCYFFNSDLI